jgi:hypothetical protein
MTFVLVAANADQVIQVSDRQITGWDGSVLQEAYGKAGHLLCDDASVIYAFAGFATLGTFQTSTWLSSALQDSSKRYSRFQELIEHFAEIATSAFRSDIRILAAPPEHRKLTVMLTGYTAAGFIVNAMVSNFQDFTNFINYPIAQSMFTVHWEISCAPAPHNPTFIQAIGAFRAMTDEDEQELRIMLNNRAPHEAVRAKAAAIAANISDRCRSFGTVGKRLNTASISFKQPWTVCSGYDSDIVEQEIPMIDMVDGRAGGTGLLVGQLTLTADKVVIFPKVHRNAPCPCGSGERFRFCHRSRGA